MFHHLGGPADPFGVGHYLVANVASKAVKVVLTGDGGDENFAGYDRFAGQRLVDYYQVLPHWFRKQVRSEEHTSELQSLMRISYAVFCLKKQHTKFIYIYNHISKS